MAEKKIRADRIVLSAIAGKPEVSREVARGLCAGVMEPKKVEYLLYLSQLGNRTRAAQAAGVSRMAAWLWNRDDRNFQAAHDRCMKIAAELHEDELFRRASEGVLEPVFQGGHLVGSVRKYSDTLLIFGLKGAMPDKYADRQKIEAEVNVVERLHAARERVLKRKT